MLSLQVEAGGSRVSGYDARLHTELDTSLHYMSYMRLYLKKSKERQTAVLKSARSYLVRGLPFFREPELMLWVTVIRTPTLPQAPCPYIHLF